MKFKILATITLLLSIIDAVFTIYVVSNQYAIEINPLMRWLMECDYLLFAFIKIILTAWGVGFLASVKSKLLYFTTVSYSILIGYEIWAIWKIILFSY